jgi:hypothetical protein
MIVACEEPVLVRSVVGGRPDVMGSNPAVSANIYSDLNHASIQMTVGICIRRTRKSNLLRAHINLSVVLTRNCRCDNHPQRQEQIESVPAPQSPVTGSSGSLSLSTPDILASLPSLLWQAGNVSHAADDDYLGPELEDGFLVQNVPIKNPDVGFDECQEEPAGFEATNKDLERQIAAPDSYGPPAGLDGFSDPPQANTPAHLTRSTYTDDSLRSPFQMSSQPGGHSRNEPVAHEPFAPPCVAQIHLAEQRIPPSVTPATTQTTREAERPDPQFVCSTCERSFTRRTILTNHERTHTGEKPFSCNFDGCGQTFAQQGDKTRHEHLHNIEKAFRCGEKQDGRLVWGCSKKFRRKDGLLEHHSKTKKGKQCLMDRDKLMDVNSFGDGDSLGLK